ncbi:MAG: 50S ribosomal protein L23 [Candidatus Marinimicrobia bacterium]|nr:50S ribosomal protein L23 [Candidatus Neomarinimicrobiota bacterium]
MEKERQVILEPLLTEKMTYLSDLERKYAFKIDMSANKMVVKKAIENRFNVHVEKVAIIRQNGKSKTQMIRSGGKVIRTTGRRAHWKKAIITLRPNEKIDLFEGETAV